MLDNTRKRHPYSALPDHAYWRRAIEQVAPAAIDPVVAAPFAIAAGDRIATAGSCFAQHIARRLKRHGFTYLVTERIHPIMTKADAVAYNFGTFTARYGNIYTARQLRQLIARAYGRFQPLEDAWLGEHGALIDPFRPTIQPGGFSSRREYEADRKKHFAAVRRALEQLDVLVFTLGLTECWLDSADGAVFPLCPGVAGGVFDPDRHRFHNLSVDETADDMAASIAALREVNPQARVILTVSPVPLIATAVPARHVLVSTVYSKSVLRVACEHVIQRFEGVAYFPSYEIVTGQFARGGYFAPDCREVLPAGVNHVMRVFLRHFAGIESREAVGEAPRPAASHIAEMERLAEISCDEILLDAEQA